MPNVEATKKITAATDQLDRERLSRILIDLASAHSPTGAELPAAQVVAGYLEDAGIPVEFQYMGPESANVIGRIRGTGRGPSLMLYAPIDTHLEADAAIDLPSAGPKLRPDMLPAAFVDGDFIVGLGASNPKGMAATMLESALALKAASLDLPGDIIIAFAGGGMPINASQRNNRGLSDGVYHMLSRGVCADYAIVMKPGLGVYHEEPGLCWFKLSVRGQFGYAGIPAGIMPNSIPRAAKVIEEIEKWIPTYTARHTKGQVAPRGAITAVRAGVVDRLAFTPATTEIYVDIRCAPNTPPASVRAQFEDALNDIRAKYPEIIIDLDMCAAYPGSNTPDDNWIIKSLIRGWEAVEGSHTNPPPNSGQTDISLIRNLGIPTARLGWPATPKNLPAQYAGGMGGMGVASVADLIIAAKKIVFASVDTCSQSRADLNLT